MSVTMGVSASAIGALVAFSVVGIPEMDDDYGRWFIQFMFGLSVFAGISGALPFVKHAEVRTFKAAMPLNDPAAVLPGSRVTPRYVVDRRFLLLLLVPSLIAALLWSPWAALFPLTLAVEWLMRAGLAAHWERRHGVLLWRGEVKEQPLGKGQLLYSSPRPGPSSTDIGGPQDCV
ncbi:hypothetical protein [Streptomyces odonnellii]|uniref:hypothetical protein n=1 Tax=Streptomyces odonnellii TaxID=1417980 RepID=UPI0012FF4AD0|nr:hypothetical protein [Streptomyces odonnellii]